MGCLSNLYAFQLFYHTTSQLRDFERFYEKRLIQYWEAPMNVFLTDGTSDHCVPYLDISFRGCSVPSQYVLYGVSVGIIWVSNSITNMLLQWRNDRFPYVSIIPAYWWIPLAKLGNARLWRFFYLILSVLLKKQSVWISRWLVVYQGNEDESAEIVFHCKCLLNDSYAQNPYY